MVKLNCQETNLPKPLKELHVYDTTQTAFFSRIFFGLPRKIWKWHFDTSCIETYVTVNNPKFANRIISELKSFKRTINPNDSYPDIFIDDAAFDNSIIYKSLLQNILLLVNNNYIHILL